MEKKPADLPQDFKERMKKQLGGGYEAFLAGYEKERTYGLRYNPLKIEKEKLAAVFKAQQVILEPVPWVEEGFYYPASAQPGRHPLHEAGAYYIQEPSAMAVVELLDPKPGDLVLDLCAAPGGKSTQTAGRMRGKGLLVANELIPSRAKTLSRNMERMGVANAVVLNETPGRLAERFPAFFDRIVVDAPCSGEGMFRKDPQARGEWSLQQVEACAMRQREILSQAVKMLKPGGCLVYSTCTFAPAENEENARWLTAEYPRLVLEQSMHIWPHLHRGEGHYAAKFRCQCLSEENRNENKKENKKEFNKKYYKNSISQNCPAVLWKFLRETFSEETADYFEERIAMGRLAAFGESFYLLPDGIEIDKIDGWKVERAGLQLGRWRKNWFEPSHALAMALRPAQARQSLELEEPEKYLRGETTACSGCSGWVLAAVEGCSVGWGKAGQGVLKNHYPKGLRRA